jgi:hypothetical protein
MHPFVCLWDVGCLMRGWGLILHGTDNAWIFVGALKSQKKKIHFVHALFVFSQMKETYFIVEKTQRLL